MQGTLSIFQGYLEGGKPLIEPEPLLQENNLIVDGMKEHIVDMMTRIPAPSAVSADVAPTYNVSNFTVHALSVGPNRSAFERVHGLAALSATVSTGATTAVVKNLDPSDGTVWAYNADIPNHLFSSVNVSGGISPNGQLSNPAFSAVDARLINGTFRDYSLDASLSGVHMNEILGLYDLNGWDVYSFLRYDTTAPEYIDTLELGSCARYDFSEVSSIYSSLSGTNASSTFAEPDDGILFIRSFNYGDDAAPSGAVHLTQEFSVRTPDVLVEASLDGTDNVLAEITAQFSSLSSVGADANIKMSVRDMTAGESYNFSAQGDFDRHSWGTSGAPLTVNASADTSGTISEFINIPSSKVANTFKVRFEFFAHDSSDILKCYFWNANVNLLEGWKWGNIFSGQGIHRVWDNDYRNPALFIDASGSVSAGLETLPLSSTTYLAQPFKMKPLKKYSVITAFSGTEAFTDGFDEINTVVTKRFTSDPSGIASYNFLTTLSSAPLVETRLPYNFAFSPDFPPTSPPAAREIQKADIKPSDLCLEVSSGDVVSGTFELSAPGLLRGELLKTFGTGVSATDELRISVRTDGRDPDGNRRWFNFYTGGWEVYSDAVSSEVYLDSSSYTGEGFVEFAPPQLSLNALMGVINQTANNEFTLILSLENTGTNPAFVKNLRVNSLPKSLAQDTQEVYNFHATDPDSAWSVLSTSGQNIFSGLSTGQAPNSNSTCTTSFNTLGLYPLEAMYEASGSCHNSESDYRFYLVQSAATSSVASPGGAGQAYKFNLINIVDASLVAATKPITGDILTSESYVTTESFDIVNEPFIDWRDTANVYPTSSYVHPGVCMQSPQRPLYAGLINQSTHSLLFGSVNDPGGTNWPVASLAYTENLKDIILPLSATQRSFSIEYNQLIDGAEPIMKFRVAATTKDGAVVWWDGTTWDEYDSPPLNDFLSTPQRGNSGVIKTTLSTRYDLTNERFDDTTKFKTQIVMYHWDSYDVVTLLNWKFFTNGPYPEADMPEFPAPNHTTLQPPVSPYAELGQYTNQIALSGALSSISYDRALGNLNWAPSSGLAISGADVASIQNEYGAVNSDGYVLFGYNGPITARSSDYYVNGFHTTSSTSSMTYSMDVSSTALDYFEFQGGIGTIGLHTLKVNETYRKLIDGGYTLGEVYDKGDTPADKLYNLDDVARNPVFRLAAKKVFRTPLNYTTGTNKFIRFNWEIRFI